MSMDGMSSRPKDSGPSEMTDEQRELAAQIATEKADQQPFTGAVIFCPVCCTNVDAQEYWGHHEYDCDNCHTHFTLELTPEAVHEHSMIG